MRYLIWIVLGALVIIRIIFSQPSYTDGQKVRITGKITSVPIKYSNTQRVEIAGLKIYLPLFPEISYGDKIIVEGSVEKRNLKDPHLLEITDEKNWLENFRQKI